MTERLVHPEQAAQAVAGEVGRHDQQVHFRDDLAVNVDQTAAVVGLAGHVGGDAVAGRRIALVVREAQS
ncbi:hypothetical protein [Streptomyces sp. BV129]|uniref:hypothetical protein n=1 Tax=Streptomyces sp. BV129 TaxID=2849671 RepID=UPI001C2DF1B4|nr:hypothetical protein [Streptomyces sp. BV129]MBV1946360.1 hypothetical protein [Streptomyces sp. BV129]